LGRNNEEEEEDGEEIKSNGIHGLDLS
jgi:hypothetical protein